MKVPRTDAHIAIHTDEFSGPPLSKERISIYNSCLVPIERYVADRAYYQEVGAESLRIDLGWGAEWMPRGVDVIQPDPTIDSSWIYDFSETDAIASFLNSVDTRPYWSYCYVPRWARNPSQSWRGMATDDSIWVNTVAAYVADCHARGVEVGYHEVYNEPDLRDERTGESVFYDGDLDDYLTLYRTTSKAIREVDPQGLIGGPALACAVENKRWLDRFLEMVAEENLPLDFLSFHHYGHFQLDATIAAVREALSRFDCFPNLELHLNEYNSFLIDYPRGGLQDGPFLASSFAAEIPRLLSYRDVTKTSWAQFQDSGEGNFSGMIDIDGLPKPIYQVYQFYMSMPLDQVKVDVDGPIGLGALASAGADHGAAMIWNRSPQDVRVHLHVDSRFGEPDLTILSTDGCHKIVLDSSRLHLKAGAVALLGSADSSPRPTRRGRVVWRRPDPSDSSWIDLDEATGVVRYFSGTGVVEGSQIALDTTDSGLAHARWELSSSKSLGLDLHVSVSTQTQTETHEQILTGNPDGDTPPDAGMTDRRRPAGHSRIAFSIQECPPNTHLAIRPKE